MGETAVFDLATGKLDAALFPFLLAQLIKPGLRRQQRRRCRRPILLLTFDHEKLRSLDKQHKLDVSAAKFAISFPFTSGQHT